jgi:transcriptional regulator with XRE-family HTH domain
MPRQAHPQWLQLGAELRKLRTLSGLSTRDMAARAGLSNARVSRVETGQSLLSLPEIDAWASAAGAGADARERLQRLAETAHTAIDLFRAAQAELEDSAADIEARAGRIITVQPQIVPGLLQTASYARAVLALVDTIGRDIPAAVAARMRRQEALYEPAKQFEFLLTEAALRWPAGDPAVMAAQYDRVSQLSRLDNVRVGIIPLGRAVSALPWCDVNIYDDLADGEPPIVDIELPHGELWLTDSTDVTVYVDLVHRLWESALADQAARDLLSRLSTETRTT